MINKSSDKIIYLNFDAIYLKSLFFGVGGVWHHIIGNACSNIAPEQWGGVRRALPMVNIEQCVECSKNDYRSGVVVSCRLQDLVHHLTNDKKTMQIFAVKLALKSFCRKKQWMLCSRRMLVSRLAGYRTAVSEETLLQDKSYNWASLLDKKNRLWRTIKEKLKDDEISFITPIGCRGFVFGFMSKDELQYKYDCWLAEQNTTEEQKDAIMKKLGIPELPFLAPEARPSKTPAL